MSTMQQEPVQQQVVGQLIGMEQRQQGWVAVSIQVPGKQYPVKLSTKRPELIQQASQLVMQTVTAAYNEQLSSQINPYTSQPYTNRYLEALALGAVDLVGPTQIQPQEVLLQHIPVQPQQNPMLPAQPMPLPPQPTQVIQTPPPVNPTEVKIHRQTATKVAVQVLAYLAPEEQSLANLIRISEQLVKYYDDGVNWLVPPVEVAPQYPAQQDGAYGDPNQPDYAEQPPPHQDDDIPF